MRMLTRIILLAIIQYKALLIQNDLFGTGLQFIDVEDVVELLERQDREMRTLTMTITTTNLRFQR